MGAHTEDHYLAVIQRIVDQQKELVGEETALKWARKAPLEVDADGTVTGYYGSGEDAVALLRRYTEHESFYLAAIRAVIARFIAFSGEQVAMQAAREAPLEIDPDGSIAFYYGNGRTALATLLDRYEAVFGARVAQQQAHRAIRPVVAEQGEWAYVPPRLRPAAIQTTDSFTTWLVDRLRKLVP